MNPEKSGVYGWAAIAGFVVAWDVLAPESLSHAFERARESENPLVRIAAIGGLAITAAHLMGAISRDYDPFYLLVDRVISQPTNDEV